MREILFRGKRKDNGEWIEGSLFQSWSGTAYILGELATNVKYEVIPETVGEITGLTDKNGKKIFEGDIMCNAGNVVEFCSGIFCINGDSPLAFWANTEIIGNIHDNPELMELK